MRVFSSAPVVVEQVAYLFHVSATGDWRRTAEVRERERERDRERKRDREIEREIKKDRIKRGIERIRWGEGGDVAEMDRREERGMERWILE